MNENKELRYYCILGNNITCTALEKFYTWYLRNAIPCQITLFTVMCTNEDYFISEKMLYYLLEKAGAW